MARKTAITPEASLLVGLDIGYGVTKVVTNAACVAFPSVWGVARDARFQAEELAKRYPGERITDDEGTFFVGDLALSQLRPEQVRYLRGRTSDETALGNVARLRLLSVALGKLMPGVRGRDAVHVTLATGLPVDHMRGAAAFKESLIGRHLVQTDDVEMIVNICKVYCLPQPYGCLYRHALTKEGALNRSYKSKRTGILDVGTFTIDVAVDDQSYFVDSESGSLESGLYIVHTAIAEVYNRDHGSMPHHTKVDDILRTGKTTVRGVEYDYREEVAQAIKNLEQAALQLVNDKWGIGDRVDTIYVCGGGAGLVFSAIKGFYPHAVLTPNAQMANAQGYFQYGLFAGQAQ